MGLFDLLKTTTFNGVEYSGVEKGEGSLGRVVGRYLRVNDRIKGQGRINFKL